MHIIGKLLRTDYLYIKPYKIQMEEKREKALSLTGRASSALSAGPLARIHRSSKAGISRCHGLDEAKGRPCFLFLGALEEQI